VSTGLAGPVSAPAHSLPAGSPPTLGSHGALGSVGPSHVGVFALRYPSGQADPLDIGGQMSTSSATGIVVAEIHAEREQSSDGDTITSRQPSATAAAARLPLEGPSHLPLPPRLSTRVPVVCRVSDVRMHASATALFVVHCTRHFADQYVGGRAFSAAATSV